MLILPRLSHQRRRMRVDIAVQPGVKEGCLPPTTIGESIRIGIDKWVGASELMTEYDGIPDGINGGKTRRGWLTRMSPELERR